MSSLAAEAELALVDGLQLVGRLEGAVVVGRPLPGHVGRARDVAAAQRPLLGVVGHGQQLARVLAGRAHVDQPAAVADVLEDLVAEDADGRVVALHHRVVGGLAGGHVGGQGPALLHPLLAAAVQQPHVPVAEQGRHPQGVGGPPVEVVAVEHHGGVAPDALGRHQPGEALAAHVVPLDGVVQVQVPVDLDRARDVPGLVQQDVLVRLGHHQVGVAEVLGQPGRCHQALGVGVGAELGGRVELRRSGHGSSSDGVPPVVGPHDSAVT